MKFECTACGLAIQVPDTDQASTFLCGHCGGQVQAPVDDTAPGCIVDDDFVIAGPPVADALFPANQYSLGQAVWIYMLPGDPDKTAITEFIAVARDRANNRNWQPRPIAAGRCKAGYYHVYERSEVNPDAQIAAITGTI